MRTQILLTAGLLAAGIASAQASPPQMSHDTAHMQHVMKRAGFAPGEMHHATARGVKLDAKVDEAAHTIVLREGPLDLPAHTDHMQMPQPPDLIWTIPMDGWLLSYSPKLIESHGNSVPGRVLHHVAFWNENRRDFLCPNKEEHIFGAGGEMTDWAQVPGYGYRVRKGDRIRIETMVHNPTNTSFDNVYLDVTIPYTQAGTGADSAPPVKNYYPAWMDAMSCGDSGYDLPPGKSVRVGQVTLKYSGVLLGVGGHMHDYGKELILADSTRKETVAALEARLDDHGRLESMPTKTFFEGGGFKLAAGDHLKITSTYQNASGRLLRDGAMGIVVGYFVPLDDSKMASLRRIPKPVAHSMTGMPHNQ